MTQYQFKRLNDTIHKHKELLKEDYLSKEIKGLIQTEIAQLERKRKKVLKANMGVIL